MILPLALAPAALRDLGLAETLPLPLGRKSGEAVVLGSRKSLESQKPLALDSSFPWLDRSLQERGRLESCLGK